MYEGKSDNVDFKPEQGNPKELCLLLLRTLQKQLRYDQLCIVSTKFPMIICNTNPINCFVTTLSSSEVEELIEDIAKNNSSKTAIKEYQGTFVLPL